MRRIPWPVEEGANAEIVSYGAKTNLRLKGEKKFFKLAAEKTASLVFVRVTKNNSGPLL